MPPFPLRQFIACILLIAFANTCLAAKKVKKNPPAQAQRVQSILVLDSDSGEVLHNQNASTQIYPASLTKLMTLYIAFEDLKSRKLGLYEQIPISKKAQNVEPSKLGLVSGKTISVKDAIMGLVIKSANDASITLAEHIGGSEELFIKRMNKTAESLGMTSSYFANPHGLHDAKQKSTAFDLAKLTLAIKKHFPEYYSLFSKDSFHYQGKLVTGHNRVTSNYEGAEGMKTGYTRAAGFNLVTTAKRQDKTLIGVVTGYPSAKSRDAAMMSILDKKFAQKGIISNCAHKKSSPKIDVAKRDEKRDVFTPVLVTKEASSPSLHAFSNLPTNKAKNKKKPSITRKTSPHKTLAYKKQPAPKTRKTIILAQKKSPKNMGKKRKILKKNRIKQKTLASA